MQNKLEKQIKIVGTHLGHRAISNNENSLKCFFSMFIGKEQTRKYRAKKNQGVSQSFFAEINNLILHILKSRFCFIADYANNHSPKQEIIIGRGQ